MGKEGVRTVELRIDYRKAAPGAILAMLGLGNYVRRGDLEPALFYSKRDGYAPPFVVSMGSGQLT